MVIAGGVALCLAGTLGWVLVSTAKQQEASGSVAAEADSSEPGSDFLTGSTSDPIGTPPSTSTTLPDRNQAPKDTSTSAQQGGQRQLDVHEQARVRAWEAYYAERATTEANRRRATLAAMEADLAGAATGGQQQPGQPASTAASAVPGAPGTVSLSQRPGTLDQGPSTMASLYLPTGPVAAISPYELKRGKTVIPYRLDQMASTGAGGQMTATVTRNVMDFASGNHILIPQGSTLVMLYEDQTTPDDERMKIAIVSITYPATGNPSCPGGEEMPIGSMPGADASGQAGLRDEVYRHTGRRLLNATIRALGGASSSVATMGGGYGPGQAVASQLAMQGSTAATTGIRDPGPTFVLRAGLPGVLQLTRSIAFTQPWRPGIGFCGAQVEAMNQ